MINSNYYACDCQTSPLTHKQSARAAFLMNFMMILKKNIETEKLRPVCLMCVCVCVRACVRACVCTNM